MGEYRCFTSNEYSVANVADEPVCQREAGVKIKCRTYGGVTIPAETEVGTAFPLVNLNVDTRDYKKPCVKVDFLSNILTDTATATLTFQLFRQCNGQLVPVAAGPIWTFSRTVATAAEANYFGFSVCDCDNCNCGCCNYSVVATVVGEDTTGTVIINNATLIATVVEGADC